MLHLYEGIMRDNSEPYRRRFRLNHQSSIFCCLAPTTIVLLPKARVATITTFSVITTYAACS